MASGNLTDLAPLQFGAGDPNAAAWGKPGRAVPFTFTARPFLAQSENLNPRRQPRCNHGPTRLPPMGEFRIRILGRSGDDGFTVTRREGEHWVWLPVRFSTYSEADRWIDEAKDRS